MKVNMDESYYASVYYMEEYSNFLEISDAMLNTVDGCKFKVHKFQLAMKSPFFRALFCGPLKEEKYEYLIPDFSGYCLSLVLVYIYTKKITITRENIVELILASKFFLLEDLFLELCKHFENNITIENSLPLLLACYQINCSDKYTVTFRFIETHFRQIIDSHQACFLEIPVDVLDEFLKSRSLYNTTEALLWKIIKEWVLIDFELRQRYVLKLLCRLARNEIEESLAIDILGDQVVKGNPYCKILQNLETGKDTLFRFLHDSSDQEQLHFRIPTRLYLYVEETITKDDRDCTTIYISYDDQKDLWRIFKEIDLRCVLIACNIERFLLFFGRRNEGDKKRFFKVDLKEDTACEINFPNNEAVKLSQTHVADKKIYYIGWPDMNDSANFFAIFDLETNTWKIGNPCQVRYTKNIAVLSNKVYVVGLNRVTNVFEVYDPYTERWAVLPSPNNRVLHHQLIDFNKFIPFNNQLFLVLQNAKRNETVSYVEMYDPVNEKWRVLDLPVLIQKLEPIILNGKLYIYDDIGEEKCATRHAKNPCVWNEEKEIWKEVSTLVLKNLNCWEIKEEDTIRSLWKGKTFSNSSLKKMDFSSPNFHCRHGYPIKSLL